MRAHKNEEKAKAPLAQRVALACVYGIGCGSLWGERTLRALAGSSTASVLAIVHFGSVGRLCGLFERSKAT